MVDSKVRGYVQFDMIRDSSILEGSGHFNTSKPLSSGMLRKYELVFDNPILRIDNKEILKIPIRLAFIDTKNQKFVGFKIDTSRQKS